MAKYLVNDTSLTAVADAIRTKGGTSEALSFPDGFVSAVEGISAGGGGDSTLLSILDNSIEIFENDNIEVINKHAAFRYCSKLERIKLKNLKSTSGQYTFANCNSLIEFDAPMVTSIDGGWSLAGNISMKEYNFPMLLGMGANCFESSTSLEKVFFGAIVTFSAKAFNKCSSLKTLVLKADSVCRLSNVSAFESTPFASGGTGGTVYAPSALITQYQQATNWSTLYAAGTCNFVAIEGSEYE